MITLSEWDRGFSFAPADRADVRVYLWFYEWHLFDAFEPGQHTGGRHHPERDLDADGRRGHLRHPGLDLQITAGDDSAELELTFTNITQNPWPAIAAIIPCLNPGHAPYVAATEILFDDGHERTWFLGRDGLERLVGRHIHFHRDHSEEILAQMPASGMFPFSHKWPTSDIDASGGLILRESADLEWVTAIAWDDALSLQGHNPWRCMHQSIRVGPLEPGETKRIGGRIYLLRGSLEECLLRYRQDFGRAS